MRRRLMIASAAVSAFVLGLLGPAGVAVAGPVGTAAGFEDDDANLAPQAPINFDWNSFSPATWTGAAGVRTASKVTSGWTFTGLEDRQATTTDSGFAGGTKQDNVCPTVGTQKASNKDDLKRIYVASKTVGSNVFLTLAWVRIPQNTTSSSAHVAFEFNKGTTSCGASGLVQRTAGDMLIVYDFEGGGTPVLKLSRWISSGACEVGSNSAPCWGVATTLSSGVAEAQVNSASTAQDTVAPATETLGLQEFGEAGINLTAAGVFAPGVCEGFGKAYAVSRSSGQSSTAQMKDLVGPGNVNIRNCGSVAVTKLGSDGGSQAGAVFTLYSGTGTGGTVIGTCTVQASGACTPLFADLPVGTYTLDETTVPAGYDKDPTLPFTFSVAAGESKSLTFTDPARPATVNVQKKDDANAPVPGAVFTLSQGATVIGTCTTDAAGVCQPPFTNLPAGTYTIDETTTPTGYAKDASLPLTFSVARGETKNLSFTNPRTFKVIVLVCREADSKLYPSPVTIDGQAAGSTLSSAQASAAGLGEAALCGIATGQRGGLLTGDHSADPIGIG
ncbi:Cna protein B-type domain-containing protein [Lentzea waywayandensis]|uniref:Cna protein B-type domain-containing protein n=1 Tax=Lentzea waywayandensis TaxID=84724 RepID=A0A1I6EH37_9PSEU|nr:SpaA isopeptide-forming pilin-related protein [Lentzea waywayandensis]SFR16792.1 Cna protein B-type domain-containing protein [Lentzea waywayandensis]